MKVFSYLLPLVWLFIAFDSVNAQGDEDVTLSLTQDDKETQKDNEFPLEPEPDSDVTTTEQIENLLTTDTEPTTEKAELEITTTMTPLTNDLNCPEQCICSQEEVGESVRTSVNCSSKDLTELPVNIDPKTNVLSFQNNQITELPIQISDLSELEVLDAANNQITGFTKGSISNLKKLRVLNVSNNRLTELPQELKDAVDLQALEELDLSGNDIGNITTADISHLTVIEELKLPESIENITTANFCQAMTKLKKVCFGDCDFQEVICDQRQENESDNFIAAPTNDVTLDETKDEMGENEATVSTTEPNSTDDLPMTSELETGLEKTDETEIEQNNNLPDVGIEQNVNEGPIESVNNNVADTSENATEDSNDLNSQDILPEANSNVSNEDSTGDNSRKNSSPTNATAINISESEKSQSPSSIQDNDVQNQAPDSTIGKDNTDSVTNLEGGKVGEVVTISSKGGIDNSIIGLIIGTMIVIVAGVTIKKNWSVIRRKCGGRPRPDPSHSNGISPEEVPLKDKSPA